MWKKKIDVEFDWFFRLLYKGWVNKELFKCIFKKNILWLEFYFYFESYLIFFFGFYFFFLNFEVFYELVWFD